MTTLVRYNRWLFVWFILIAIPPKSTNGQSWGGRSTCFAIPSKSKVGTAPLFFLVSDCKGGPSEMVFLEGKGRHQEIVWKSNLSNGLGTNKNHPIECAGFPNGFKCRFPNEMEMSERPTFDTEFYCQMDAPATFKVFGDFGCGIEVPKGTGLIFLDSNLSGNVLLEASWGVGGPSVWIGKSTVSRSEISIFFDHPMRKIEDLTLKGTAKDSGLELDCILHSKGRGQLDWCTTNSFFRQYR